MGNGPLQISRKQIVVASVIILFVFLMMDLNARLAELSRQSGQRDRMQTEAVNLMRTEAALQAKIDYATSDLAVEEWAREQGHMQRSGDVVIVPLPGEGVTPTPAVTVEPTLTPVPKWQIWRMLILGE